MNILQIGMYLILLVVNANIVNLIFQAFLAGRFKLAAFGFIAWIATQNGLPAALLG